MLEKSRTCRQAALERSFHIFYQFLRGASADEKELFLLENIEKYNFVKNGPIELPNVDDAIEFLNTRKSMEVMGFNSDEVTCKL